MKIKLPKDLRGVKFPQVLTIDMNDFDIDIFLPMLFFTILSQGKGKARVTNDPKAIAEFVDKLARHQALEGFDDIEGRRVLERLVRTALITTSSVGRSHTSEQITSIVPYTLLAYKPGFPITRRSRGVDTFIYQALRERIGADSALRDFVKKVFGHGVVIGSIAELGGNYDGTTELDTMARLSIAFVDGFQPTRPGISRERNVPGSCPGLMKELATDLLRYLFEFHTAMPIQAFSHYLLTLINFELFNYTLKLVHAINALVRNPEILPPAMCDPVKPSSPQIYVDFTGLSSGLSMDMAKACVRRDIEAYQQFLFSILSLRQLDLYVTNLKRNIRRKADIEKALQAGMTGPIYLQGLLLLQQHPTIGPAIEAAAQHDVDRIFQENTTGKDEDSALLQNQLDMIACTAESDIEQVVNLLVEGQRQDGIKHFMHWYLSVGGIKTPQGILRGSTLHRRSWRYAPTNDLLATLVQVAAARLVSPQQIREGERVRPIRMQEFLTFLEERFGIIVDRPPAPFEGAEYVAAAHENLRAMQRRLRQMGIFRDLSDDFNVQRLYPPYAGKDLVKR